MKIIGTGLTGLVGSRIVELLGPDFEFEDLPFDKGFDITKKETIEQKIASSSADFLIHLAAFTDVNAAWKQKNDKNGLCYQVNVVGTKNIVNLCNKYKKFLLHFSTDFVFDGGKGEPYREDDKPNPIEWYGQTKYWAEEEVKDFGYEFCIIRIGFPFRSKYLLKSDLVRKIIDGFNAKSLYPLFSDQIITPTFIDDIAVGVERIVKNKITGIFHLVGSTSLSPFELGKKIAKTFNFDENLVREGSLSEFVKNNPNSRPYQKNLSLSNKKAEKLGIEMKTIGEALMTLKEQRVASHLEGWIAFLKQYPKR